MILTEIIAKIESLLLLLKQQPSTTDIKILESKILFSLGGLQIKKENTNNSMRFYEQCMRLRKEIFGIQSNEYARTLTMIAITLKHDPQKQYEMLKEAFEIRKTVVGEKGQLSAQIDNNSLEELSALEEAETFFVESSILKNSVTYTFIQFRLINLYFQLGKGNLAEQKLENFYFQPDVQSSQIKNKYEYELACAYYYKGNNDDAALKHCQKAFYESEIASNQRVAAGIMLVNIYIAKADKENCLHILSTIYKESKENINQSLYLRENSENIDTFINNFRTISSALLILSDYFKDDKFDIELIYDAVLYNKNLLFNFEKLLSVDYSKKADKYIAKLQKEQEELKQQCVELEIKRQKRDELQEKQQKIVSISEILQDPAQMHNKIVKKWDESYLADDQLLLECYAIQLSSDFMGFEIKHAEGLLKDDTIFKHNKIQTVDQAFLKDDTNRLVYEQIKDAPSTEIYMFFVVKKGKRIFSYTVSKSEIDCRIQNIRNAIDKIEPIISDTRQLYDLLFLKIESYLTDVKHILIAPDGMLFQIPFEILQNKDEEYLCERFDISYINSGNELCDIAHKPVDMHKPLLIGNPDFSMKYNKNNYSIPNPNLDIIREMLRNESINPLPFTELEVRAISKLLNVPCYCFEQANKQNFYENLDASIIHIATHGFDFNEAPEYHLKLIYNEMTTLHAHRKSLLLTGLFLSGAENTFRDNSDADDGILTAEEVTKLDLSKTDLVVLSACGTGKGYYLRNEGIWGIRRSFELAGAHSLLISLWNVNDLSTYILMQRFYEYLTVGHSRTEALKLSQYYVKNLTKKELFKIWLTSETKAFLHQYNLRTRESSILNKIELDEKIFSHPKYWAGFVLYGSWN